MIHGHGFHKAKAGGERHGGYDYVAREQRSTEYPEIAQALFCIRTVDTLATPRVSYSQQQL